MKYLIKKIFRNHKVINLRNLFSLKPVKINTSDLSSNHSISDSFPWRTDNNYSTIFRFQNILKFFYHDEKNIVDINFFTKEGELIKELRDYNIDSHNEIVINKKLLNEVEDYGSFSIYHKSDFDRNSIRNSCYTGFSFKKKSYVYVHGNLPTSARKLKNSNSKTITGIIGKSFLTNQIYKIQNCFDESDFIELFIHNPCNSSVKAIINNQKISLNKNSSRIIRIFEKEITIRSNCYLLRPIIFDYKKDTVDVFHG